MLLVELGLDADEDRLAGTLAYGQQRRVEIGRALASRPRLLCLDEPAAGMNDAESGALAEFIRKLPQRGVSVLLVEHDMQVVRTVCSRLVVMTEGTVLATGPSDDVLSRSDVIAAYLGSANA